MSLATALNIAQSALGNTSRQTSILSRNIADAQNPDYTRRIAVITSTAPGARSVEIRRAANDLLFKNNLGAQSSLQAQQTLYAGMDRLGLSVNGAENSASAATALSKLQQALQTYSATPSNKNVADATVSAARNMVRTLNAGTASIQSFRSEMDSEIASSVSELNDLLGQFKSANDDIVRGTQSGVDVNDSLDRRDALLKQISDIVSISTITRSGNDMVIVTRDGATLFETVPRTVSFEPNAAYAAGTPGNSVFIDGIPVAPGSGGNTDGGGRIAGLIQLRDTVAGTMQSQLDEIARGLITAFAETDAAGGALPPKGGLFTWGASSDIPPAGTVVSGLAGLIALNAAYDPDKGGDSSLLRDGGANGAGYDHNPTGAASFADQLIGYIDSLDRPMDFDTASGNGGTKTLTNYASGAIGWFEGVRKDASSAADAKQALAFRTAEALSNATGVNIDNEMSLLLDLEHTYQASARLMKAVDDMLNTLLTAVG